jgi:hypothetical protein
LPLTYFYWIFPLTEEKGLVKSVWDFRGVTLISAVSMTLLKYFPLCNWHRWNDFSGVNYTVEIISAVSISPRKSFQRCHWHRWN